MAYAPFADEATAREMSVEWRVDYQTMCRIIRNTGMRPARRNFASKYYDREQQAQLARDVAKYHLAPRYLDLEPEEAGGEPETRNVSSQTQLRERCRVAEGRVKRLMEMVEADQTEILALRAERQALMGDNDQLRAHSTPEYDANDGLLARLIQVASLDEHGYAALAHAALDTDADAALVLDGALKLLGVTLDAGLRKADNRLLTTAQAMTVYTALSTLARLGQMADSRLTQYAGVADALLARHQAPDTRTPEKAEVHP